MSITADPPSGGGGEREIPISPDDIGVLLRALASVYNNEERAMTILRQVRYPRELVPGWQGSTSIGFWSQIFEDLDRGVMAAPYRRLLREAASLYVTNPSLAGLNGRYLETQPLSAEPQPPGAQEPPNELPQAQVPEPTETCHLVGWLDSAEQRDALFAWLTEQGLAPETEWSTPSNVSFRLNQADPQAVDRVMLARHDFAWQVVAPGNPDYVLRYLSVQGPDGRSFRFNDVPSATPVSSVADELVEQYTEGLPGGDQATVVEHVGPEGPRRMNPDNTIGEEGITEGSRLRVAFERRAAAVNPLDRREALLRVRNQIDEYRDSRPGFRYAPNSPALPTEYDIEFIQPSFGPSAVAGGEPADISVHQLSIVLPPDFPIVAPRVRWLTDIYHPNVYPTYESERLRENPYARGIVCLGTLTESYVPSLDFGELCATLVDIAGFRNYSVWVPASDKVDDRTGQPLLRGDFYDRDAASWTISPRGQERIVKIGGSPVLRGLSARPTRYGFEIEDVSELDIVENVSELD
jgi:hypothetical protein